MCKLKKDNLILYGCLVIIIFILIYCDKSYKADSVEFFDGSYIEKWSSEWTYKEKEITIPTKLKVKTGSSFTIKRTLPDKIEGDSALCFRSYHSFVTVKIDNRTVYQFGNEKELPFGKSPGSLWNVINLSPEDEGKELSLTLRCPYKKYSGQIREMIYGTRSNTILFIYHDSLSLVIMSAIPFIVGIMLILLFFIAIHMMDGMLFLDTGLFLVCISLWGFSESRYFQFYIGNAFMVETSTFLFMILSIGFCVLSLKELNIIQNSKIYRICLLMIVGVFVLVNLLQFLEIADYFDTLGLFHLAVLATSVLLTIDIRKNLMKQALEKRDKKLLSVGFLFLAGSAVADTYEFYFVDMLGNGFFIRMGILVFMTFIGLWTVRHAIKIQVDNVEKATYEKMAYTDTMTGLKNRRAFNEQVEEINLNRMEHSFIFLDINYLKQINDYFGHEAGDRAIMYVGESIRNFRCKGDWGFECYRIGGDEFAIISRCTDIETLEECCENINIRLDEIAKDLEFPISLAYGFDIFTDKWEGNISELISSADKDMYKRKDAQKQERPWDNRDLRDS